MAKKNKLHQVRRKAPKKVTLTAKQVKDITKICQVADEIMWEAFDGVKDGAFDAKLDLGYKHLIELLKDAILNKDLL
jgi:hypothetical protein